MKYGIVYLLAFLLVSCSDSSSGSETNERVYISNDKRQCEFKGDTPAKSNLKFIVDRDQQELKKFIPIKRSGGLIRLFNCPNTAAVVLSPVAPLVPKDPLPSL